MASARTVTPLSWNQALDERDAWVTSSIGVMPAPHLAQLSCVSIEPRDRVYRFGRKKAGYSRARSRQRHDATRRPPRDARNHPHRRPRGDSGLNAAWSPTAVRHLRGPCFFCCFAYKARFQTARRKGCCGGSLRCFRHLSLARNGGRDQRFRAAGTFWTLAARRRLKQNAQT